VDKKDLAVGTFSKGMRQKVRSGGLVTTPRSCFLDEPTANLAQSLQDDQGVILELKMGEEDGLLNTHNLDEAQRVCDRVGILKGRLLAWAAG